MSPGDSEGTPGRISPELRDGAPTSEQLSAVISALNSLLQDARFIHDARIPSERELASRLGVSRRLVRKGLGRLEAAGKIWRHHGKGTFIGSRPTTHANLDTYATSNPAEVMEARLELEPGLAALAALRATDHEVREIRWCLAKSRLAQDLPTFELWDARLHRAIAEAAHNDLLLTLYDIVSTARQRTNWGTLQEAAITNCGLAGIAEQHDAFVDAIARRDPIRAKHRMREHILIVRRSMFDDERGSASGRPEHE